MTSTSQYIKLLLLALAFSLGVSIVYAWSGPTSAPPNGNTPSPRDNLGNHTATQALNMNGNNITGGGSVYFGYTQVGGNLDVLGTNGINGALTVSGATSLNTLGANYVYSYGNVVATTNMSASDYYISSMSNWLSTILSQKANNSGVNGTFRIAYPSCASLVTPGEMLSGITITAGIITGVTTVTLGECPINNSD